MSLAALRVHMRRSFPFGVMLTIGLALMAFHGRSITDNFVYLGLLLPFALSITADDLRRMTRNPVLIAVAIYLLALWVSLIGNGDATLAVALSYLNRMLIELCFVALIAWYVSRARPSGEIAVALALSVLLTGDVLFSIWWFRDAAVAPGAAMSLSPWPNPNTGAAVCAVAVLLLINAALRTDRHALPFVIGGMVIVIVIAILLSRSRAGLVMVVMSLVVIPIVQRRWKMLGGAILLVAFLMTMAAFVGLVDLAEMLARGDAARFTLWQSFSEVARENIWRGIGIHREFSVSFRGAGGDSLDNPHNMLIASALYGGIAALVAWVVLLLVTFKVAFDAARAQADGLALCLSIFLITYGMVESVLLTTRANWQWIVYLIPLGCIAGVWSARQMISAKSPA